MFPEHDELDYDLTLDCELDWTNGLKCCWIYADEYD